MTIQMTFVRVVVLLCFPCATHLAAQIPSNVYTRVLHLKIDNQTGSGFTTERDGQQYIITAKHLISSLDDEGTVHIFQSDAWQPIEVKVLRCDDPIDIAVLIPPDRLTATYPLELSQKDVVYGQDVYLVGFPLHLYTGGKNVNASRPLAFFARGIMSASRDGGGVGEIYVDGQNNHGFSGGPIVYRDLNERGKFVFKVLAVISGYRFRLESVYQEEEILEEDITDDDLTPDRIVRGGKVFRLKETGQYVKVNTGIAVGHAISHAVELIETHASTTVP